MAVLDCVFKKSASNKPATSLGCTGANATRPLAVATSTNGSNQKSPRDPLRTSSILMPRFWASNAMAFAVRSAPTLSALESRGTYILVIGKSLMMHAPRLSILPLLMHPRAHKRHHPSSHWASRHNCLSNR